MNTTLEGFPKIPQPEDAAPPDPEYLERVERAKQLNKVHMGNIQPESLPALEPNAPRLDFSQHIGKLFAGPNAYLTQNGNLFDFGGRFIRKA